MAGSPVAERFVAPLFVRRVGKELPWGLTRNLSVSGMFLESRDRDPVGAEHTISFVWGDEVHTCRARVMRHAEEGLGLMFIDPDQPFIDAVEEVIASSPIVQGRVDPRAPGSGSDPAG